MKKTIKYIFAFVIGCLAFTSCQDPYANQTVAKPGSYDQISLQDTTGFVAAMKQANVTILPANLNDSLSIITCTSVPTLVDTAAKAVYKLQFSNTADFASYHVIPFTFNGKSGSDFKVSYKDLNDTLFFMNSTSGQRDVYAKVFAYVTRNGLKTLIKAITLKFQATPVPLKAYTAITPRPWYIVGLGGHWDNKIAGLGSSLIPLDVVTGSNYNDTGDGKFTYTGYFKASDGFKILRNIGDWDNDIWGMNGSTYTHNGGGNISVAADGYYTVTLNSITNVLTIKPATVTPTTYASIDMPGGYNGWSISNYMTLNTTTNHTWYYTLTLTAESQLKFRANADPNWTVNWGPASSADGDPLYSFTGVGALGGKNIIKGIGTYVVMFNDISGGYYFIKQ